jgi:hypothetical protein
MLISIADVQFSKLKVIGLFRNLRWASLQYRHSALEELSVVCRFGMGDIFVKFAKEEFFARFFVTVGPASSTDHKAGTIFFKSAHFLGSNKFK